MIKILFCLGVCIAAVLGAAAALFYLLIHADWLGLKRTIGSVLFFAILFYIAMGFRAVARYFNAKADQYEVER